MTAHFKRILAYTLSIGLGGVLLYFAMRGVEFDAFGDALKNASYVWVIPLLVTILLSHFLRAWRWQMLLEALPDQQRSGELKRVSLKNSFLSVMIGYLVNFLAPRLGEVVRAGNIARQENLRFSGVFGTVVVERILDLFVLLLGIVSLSFLFTEQFNFLQLFVQERILTPAFAEGSLSSLWWILGGVGGLFALSFIAYRTLSRSQATRIKNLRRRLAAIITAFKDGVLTVLRAPNRINLVVSTVLMWGLYTVMAYIPLMMLNMHTTYNLDLSVAWSLMIFGAIGMAVPSTGGIGSYHLITKLVLVNLYFVDEDPAVIYAVLNHGFHMLVYILFGTLAFIIQGVTLKSLRSSTIELDGSS